MDQAGKSVYKYAVHIRKEPNCSYCERGKAVPSPVREIKSVRRDCGRRICLQAWHGSASVRTRRENMSYWCIIEAFMVVAVWLWTRHLPVGAVCWSRTSSCTNSKMLDFRHNNDMEFMEIWGGSITLHGKLIEAKTAHPERHWRASIWIPRPGLSGVYNVNLDYKPTHTEKNLNFEHVHHRWSTKALIQVSI